MKIERAVANTLKLLRDGVLGFIDRLGGMVIWNQAGH